MSSEKSILFRGPMVQAILDGRKTQTRRLKTALSVGDRVWVRETWAVQHDFDPLPPREIPKERARVHYAADEPLGGLRVRQSIFMPRWASRIDLRVTWVREELLGDITEEDAKKEGCVAECTFCGGAGRTNECQCEMPFPDYRAAFRRLWGRLHGIDAWHTNPLVTVIGFEVIASSRGC